MKAVRGVLAGAVVLACAASVVVGTGPLASPPTADALAGTVRLNEIQTIGSHNSYHLVPSPEEVGLRSAFTLEQDLLMQYEHAPLPVQFSDQAVRQIELDVFVDTAGGLFNEPLLRSLSHPDAGPLAPELAAPGLKVLHVQDVDYASNCLTLVACLEQVKTWSDANPDHVPLAVLLELKDSPLDELIDLPVALPVVTPEPWTGPRLDELDGEIRSVFGPGDMITPDDVRGSRSTLEEAVLTDGWPTLADSRGKVMFLMDNGGGMRTTYLQDHPSLAGRVLFTNANPGNPDAAFVKRNNASDPSIPGLVSAGYVVRTRADAETVEARANNTTLRDAALASGAQWVSTDYPVPDMGFGFDTNYYAAIPGGTVARCNPVNAPPECDSTRLESPDDPGPTDPTTPPSTTGPGGSTVPGATSSVPVPTPGPSSTTPAASTPPTTATRDRPPTRPATVDSGRGAAPHAPSARPRAGRPAFTG